MQILIYGGSDNAQATLAHALVKSMSAIGLNYGIFSGGVRARKQAFRAAVASGPDDGKEAHPDYLAELLAVDGDCGDALFRGWSSVNYESTAIITGLVCPHDILARMNGQERVTVIRITSQPIAPATKNSTSHETCLSVVDYHMDVFARGNHKCFGLKVSVDESRIAELSVIDEVTDFVQRRIQRAKVVVATP